MKHTHGQLPSSREPGSIVQANRLIVPDGDVLLGLFLRLRLDLTCLQIGQGGNNLTLCTPLRLFKIHHIVEHWFFFRVHFPFCLDYLFLGGVFRRCFFTSVLFFWLLSRFGLRLCLEQIVKNRIFLWNRLCLRFVGGKRLGGNGEVQRGFGPCAGWG